MTATLPAPLLAQQVLIVDGERKHYYKLPQLLAADILREAGENLIVNIDGKEVECLSSAALCIDFPEDVEKAIALRDAFQEALDSLAQGLMEMVRYDKALAEASKPKNPLTPVVIAGEDPEGGESLNPQTWRSLQTEQDDWIFFPPERIKIVRHIEGQGLIPRDTEIPPIAFANAFTCDGEEEWEIIQELSQKVTAAQQSFLGHLRSLENYYYRKYQQLEAVEVKAEIVSDDSSLTYEESTGVKTAVLGSVNSHENEILERILLELEVENQENPSDVNLEFIDESEEGDCRTVLQFFIASQMKRDQALWMLKYKILGDRRSRKFGDFENICKRLYAKGVITFHPTTAREYAFSYEERIKLEEAKAIAPGQPVSISALLGVRQIKGIEEKKEAIEYSLSTYGEITRRGVDEYRGKPRSSAPSKSSGGGSKTSGKPAVRTESSTPENQSQQVATPSTSSEIIAVSPRGEIKEGDVVETLPGAKYIASNQVIPVGTKGTVQSVNEPPKQCYFIEQDNPEKMGHVLIENLKKVVSPVEAYNQVVEATSARIDKVLEGYKERDSESEKRIKDLEEKLQEAEKINKDLMWRFQEMAKDANDTRAKVITDAASTLQKYEEEYGITEIHPDVQNLVADLWEILRRATFDPVEDKALE